MVDGAASDPRSDGVDGDHWQPVYNLLEGHFKLLVINAQHLKKVPGRKTDMKDAQWIAQLLQCGLLRSSLSPIASSVSCGI